MEVVRTMPTKDPRAPGRANGYVPRLVQDLTGQKAPDADGEAPAPRKKRAAK